MPIALLDARARRAASAAEAADDHHRTDGSLDADLDAALEPAPGRAGARAAPNSTADLADVDDPDITAFNEMADLDSLSTVALADAASDEPTPQLTLF